jgi:hypothetical protein
MSITVDDNREVGVMTHERVRGGSGVLMGEIYAYILPSFVET